MKIFINYVQEHYEKLSEQFTEKELDEYNCMNTALAISRYANGRENDLGSFFFIKACI